MKQRTYIAIDLKSFYASVECIERNLDPLTTNLVVADESRTEKTICLAVSPALKSFGVPGRPRLFEVIERVRQVNARRLAEAGTRRFNGKSYDIRELNKNKSTELTYVVAPPRMAYYIEYSTRIYNIYLKYIAPEDIHVYSIDEVFMDVTEYLNTYKMSAHGLAMTMIRDVLRNTGITATAGIGSNLYLCKIAMDIVAKHMEADADGVRIAELDEMSYREKLWEHEPITDFWRVGKGYAEKLKKYGLYTMGDIAKCSIDNEDLLYRTFGVNAELLIDHAWGYEPCTIADIKAYRPQTNSISSGQVLQCPYEYEKAKLVVREMTDLLVLELVDKRLVTNQMTLTIGYDKENTAAKKGYKGATKTDRYGRKIPKHGHGTVNLGRHSSSTKQITEAVMGLYERIVNPNLTVRRINVTANNVIDETKALSQGTYTQLDLFTDYAGAEKEREAEEQEQKKERKIQEAMIDIKKKFGKNAVIKGMNLEEGATGRSRNRQIGGHKA